MKMERPKAHVSKEKKESVKKLTEMMEKSKVVAILNMENIPAAQLSRMKAQLRGKAEIIMRRKRILQLAIEQAKAKQKGIEQLEKFLGGMPALLVTQENPFEVYNIIKKSKTPAPAKAGQLAPRDLVIPAGPTPFTPGPIISELAGLGIKAGVEGGKVAVKVDSTICWQGQPISSKAAGILLALGIEPMEIGLDLVAAYEGGIVYKKDVLDIDETAFMLKITTAASEAFNLAIEMVYLTKDTTETLLQKAFRESKAVAIEGNILADAVVNELLAKAEAQAKSVKDEAKL
jgi:large subunit ribosomal protein L10